MNPAYFGTIAAAVVGLAGIVWGIVQHRINSRRTKQESVSSLAMRVTAIEAERRITCESHGRLLEIIPEIKRALDLLLYRHEFEDRQMMREAANAIREDTHEEPGGRDELMEKLVEGTISLPEAGRLKVMLDTYIGEAVDQTLKWYAINARTKVRWIICRHRLDRKAERLEALRERAHPGC
jgi:hypothetical protein